MKKNLKSQTTNVKLLVLVAIALLLGIAIFNQQKAKTNPASPSPSASAQPRLLPSSLTDDERFILNPPSVEASRSAKQKHAQTVAKLAKPGNSLEIKDCQPTPLVLEVKAGTEFKIKNEDNTARNIIFDEEHKYKIPEKGARTIKADFKYGSGDYGYVCEGVGLTGFLHIVP